jgi:uncharacterized protein
MMRSRRFWSRNDFGGPMATILLTIVIVLLVFAATSLGIIFGRQPIKGSCGGMSAMSGGDGACQICGGNPSKCPENESKPS